MPAPQPREGRVFTWDPTSAKLYLPKKQQGDKRDVGNDLPKELKSQPVLPANILDYLLANPHLIPEEYKGQGPLSLGAPSTATPAAACVRYLYWRGSRWSWHCGWLAHDLAATTRLWCVQELALDLGSFGPV